MTVVRWWSPFRIVTFAGAPAAEWVSSEKLGELPGPAISFARLRPTRGPRVQVARARPRESVRAVSPVIREQHDEHDQNENSSLLESLRYGMHGFLHEIRPVVKRHEFDTLRERLLDRG